MTAAVITVAGCGNGSEPAEDTPTPTSTPTVAPPTNTATPSRTATVPPTLTPTLPPPTLTPTFTGPTFTPTETPTPGEETETPTPTETPTEGPQICGDGITSGDETCDDGGLCQGGDNHGQPCNTGGEGSGAGIAACPGGGCRPFGGDGCAANCTEERTLVFNMGDPDTSMSRSTVQNPSVAIPIVLSGALTFRVGEPTGPNGSVSDVPDDEGFLPDEIPVTQVIEENIGGLLPVDVGPGVACACVRGFRAKTCGGAFDGESCTATCDGGDSDGAPCDNDDQCPGGGTCVPQDDVCPSDMPCSFIHGPNSQSSGRVSCNETGLTDIDYVSMIDSLESDMDSELVTTFDGGPAGPGSALIISSTAIGTIVGTVCEPEPGNPNKGADGIPCTDDDPDKGDLSNIPLTTGSAIGVLLNANGEPGVDIFPGATCGGAPCIAQEVGTKFDCAEIDTIFSEIPPGGMGTLPTPAGLAGTFPSEGPPPLLDIVVPSLFFSVP